MATVADVLGVDGVTETILVEAMEEEEVETTEEPLPLPDEFGVELEPHGRTTTKI